MDVYRVCLRAAGRSRPRPSAARLDTQLFLLDAGGLGVYANDDSGGRSQSPSPPAARSRPTGRQLQPRDHALQPRSRAARAARSSPTCGLLGPTGPGGPAARTGTGAPATAAPTDRLTGAAAWRADSTPPTVDLRSPSKERRWRAARASTVDFVRRRGGRLRPRLVRGRAWPTARCSTPPGRPVSVTVTARDNAGNQRGGHPHRPGGGATEPRPQSRLAGRSTAPSTCSTSR